jgi:hypothetical protein
LGALLADGRSLRLEANNLNADEDAAGGQALGLGAKDQLLELIPLLS